MDQPSYYAVIPAPVRYARIPPNAKLLYGEITALAAREGYCWATNSYFAKLYDVTGPTVSEWVKALVDLGAITISFQPSKAGIERRMYLSDPLGKTRRPPSEKPEEGSSGKAEGNNTRVNTILNIPPKAPKGPCAWEEDSAFVSVVDALKAVRADRVDLQRAWETWQAEALQEHAGAIVNAITTLAKQDSWKKEERRFVPRLSKFLHDRTWAVVSRDMLPPTVLAEFKAQKKAELDAYAEQQRREKYGR